MKLGETESDAVVLRNLPDATLSLANDSSITGPATSWVNNLGTMSVAQGDAASMDVTLIQRGVLRVEGVFGSSGAARIFGSVTGGGLATFGQAALIDAQISVRFFYADSARIFGHVTCNSSIAGAEQITLVNNAVLDFTFAEINAGRALNVAGRGVVNVAGALYVGDMTLRRAVTLNATARVNTAHYDLNDDGTFSLKPDSVTIKAVLNGTGDVAIHSQGTWTNLAQDGAQFVTVRAAPRRSTMKVCTTTSRKSEPYST